MKEVDIGKGKVAASPLEEGKSPARDGAGGRIDFRFTEETGMTGSSFFIAGIYETEDMALMQAAIDAVCNELGIMQADYDRREAVATNVLHSWTSGGRTPLNLVHAGLNAG